MTRTASALGFAGALLGVSLAGCSAPASPTPEAEEVAPVSYPIPDGCPTGAEFGDAYVSDPEWAEALDAALINGEVTTPLPAGGCAYAVGEVGTSETSSSTYRRVIVFYFNLDEPGKLTHSELMEWGVTAGGTPTAETDFDGAPTGEYSDTNLTLPSEFTDWTGADVGWVDGETSSWGWDETVVPAHTQGANGRIEMFLYADSVAAILAATTSGDGPIDPTQALAQGVGASFATTVNITDLSQGYTARVELTGQLQPWTSDVTNAAPGKFDAFGSSTVRGTQTNTTAARNTRTTGISVIAVYPLGSAACNGFNGVSVVGDDWSDSSYCAIVLGGVGAADLSPDGAQNFPAVTKVHELGSFDEGSAALSQLNAPVSVYAMFGGKGNGFTGVNWDGDKGCHVQSDLASGQWVVAMDGWPEVLCV